MARIRTIKPKFWDDVKIGRLPRDARLLYIGMWNFADDLGVVIADPVWLKSKLFPYDQIQLQQLEAWLEVLEKTGFISLLTVQSERFYYLPTFSRHQVINKPNLEDVNIRKDQLDKLLAQITEQSRINPGTLPDQSGPIIGEEKDRSNPPIIPRSGDGDQPKSDSNPLSEPEKKKSCGKRKKTLDLSSVEPSFQPIVADWLAYKSERGQTYRQKGFDAFYSRLLQISSCSAAVARKIIEQSMANNWAGIFALKDTNHERNSKNQPPNHDELARAVAEGISRANTRQEWE